MAKLYYKFGAMNSSKTANALMTRFNYEEKGKKVWLIKPALDNRDGVSVIKSRIGLQAEAYSFTSDENLWNKCPADCEVIICDESQFLSEQQVEQLRDIVSLRNIPVLCFGLRADFQTRLFPGSKRLFELADSITEIKSICRCGSKAIINGRYDENGYLCTSGDQVVIGGNDVYEGLCYNCYKRMIDNHISRFEEM